MRRHQALSRIQLFLRFRCICRPYFDLAETYHKPVAVHTGLTATDMALLKYSHPFTLDEAAVRHRNVQIVMCHIGNPFLEEAVAVLEKTTMLLLTYPDYLKERFLI